MEDPPAADQARDVGAAAQGRVRGRVGQLSLVEPAHHRTVRFSASFPDARAPQSSRRVVASRRARARAQAGHFPLNVAAEDVAKAIGGRILSGPLLTGYTQTMNDWYDRDIDAINEPYRPIPSGKIKPGEVRVPVNTRAARAVAPLLSPTLSPCRR